MTENEIDHYRSGYDECRLVILGGLKRAIRQNSATDVRVAIEALVVGLEADIERDHWESIQREFPGMTREEYDAECESSAALIRKTYYSENGYLKPHLVRQLSGE